MANEEDQKPVKKRQLSEKESRAVADYQCQAEKHTGDIFHSYNKNDLSIDATLKSDLPHADARNEFCARLYQATGFANSDAAAILIAQLAETSSPPDANEELTVKKLNQAAVKMAAMEPRDPFEGQLIAQMISVHDQIMHWTKILSRSSSFEEVNGSTNVVSKLMTRYHQALELLIKYRRGGEQRVHVEHVYVQAGGQAMLGNFQTGGGAQPKNGQATA